jgi:hypothetical protein
VLETTAAKKVGNWMLLLLLGCRRAAAVEVAVGAVWVRIAFGGTFLNFHPRCSWHGRRRKRRGRPKRPTPLRGNKRCAKKKRWVVVEAAPVFLD